MNREILFRAKNKEWNEWVEGDLIHEPFGVCIQFIKDGCKSIIKVDPKTVCQYTGLTDKNDRKIFEGDICKRTAFVLSNKIEEIFKIDFDESRCCLCTIDLDNGQKSFINDYIAYNGRDEIEVVGNIFDNPELLKGE